MSFPIVRLFRWINISKEKKLAKNKSGDSISWHVELSRCSQRNRYARFLNEHKTREPLSLFFFASLFFFLTYLSRLFCRFVLSPALLRWHDFIFGFRNSINNVGMSRWAPSTSSLWDSSLGGSPSRKDHSLLPPLSFPVRFYNFLFEKSKRGAALRLSFPFFTFFISLLLSLSLSCSSPHRAPPAECTTNGWERPKKEIVVMSAHSELGIPLRKLWGARENRGSRTMLHVY